MFKKLKLKYSILLGYSVPIVLCILVAVIVYSNCITLRKQLNLSNSAQLLVIAIKDLQSQTFERQRGTLGYLLSPQDTFLKVFEESDKELNKSLEYLVNQIKDPKQRESIVKLKDLEKRIHDHDVMLISMVKDGKRTLAIEEFRKSELPSLLRNIKGILSEFENNNSELLAEVEKTEKNLLDTLIKVVWIGALLSAGFSLLIGLLIASRISRTIVDAVNSASATSTEIAATISQHERTANQQASMVNETTTTLEELSASSRQSAEQAESAAAMAKKATTLTEEGDTAVRQALEAMEGLKIKVGAIAEQILNLSEQTGQIGSIAELVKDLAVQINMLALNAAVEAARAGEHGKGFAVVSAEVRKLAVESKKSAEQAKAIVSGIQKATDTTIMKTEEGTKNIEDVAVIARNVGNLFETLSETAGLVYNNAQQVLLNTKQQSSAISQIVEAANSMNAGAKETAAGISQTRIGIQNLNEATEKLKQMV